MSPEQATGAKGCTFDGHRRLRPGYDPLRSARGPGSLCRHHAGRYARQGAHLFARAPVATQRAGAARPGDHLPQVPGERTEPPLSQRTGTRRRPRSLDERRADPGAAGRCDHAHGNVVPAQQGPGRAGGTVDTGPRGGPRRRHLEMARGRSRAIQGRGGQRALDPAAPGPGFPRARSTGQEPDRPRATRPRSGRSSAAGSTASPKSRPRSARRSAAHIFHSASTTRRKPTCAPRSGSIPSTTALATATRSVPPICSPRSSTRPTTAPTPSRSCVAT